MPDSSRPSQVDKRRWVIEVLIPPLARVAGPRVDEPVEVVPASVVAALEARVEELEAWLIGARQAAAVLRERASVGRAMARDAMYRGAIASVALSHPQSCGCRTCRASHGDEQALREIVADLAREEDGNAV